MLSLRMINNNKETKRNIRRSHFLKKISIAVLFFFILHISVSGYGEIHEYPCSANEYFQNNQFPKYNQYIQYDYSNNLTINSDYSNSLSAESSKQPETENPLRRFEITFFISAPFVFILTFISLHTYGVIKKHDTNINVWKDYKPALLIGTSGISSAIAAREAWITMRENNKRKNQSADDRIFYFYAAKKF